jgi:hypothetical protein
MNFKIDSPRNEDHRHVAAFNRAPMSIAVGGFVCGISLTGLLVGIFQFPGDKVLIPMLITFLFLGITGLSLMQVGMQTIKAMCEDSRD